MANHRPIDELIEKSLDGAAADAELCELERRLHDPGERQAYVAAHRMNAWLEMLLQEDAAVSSTQAVLHGIGQTAGPTAHPVRSRWAAAAALLLAAVGFWWTLARVPSPPTSQAAASHLARPPATGTGIDLAHMDSISTEGAVSLFGLVTANAIK